MENEIQKTGLVSLLTENNISEETALSISTSFEDFYNQTKEWEQKATSFLNNPEISQEEKAKESRTARLALVKVRTGIDKKRKELNDDDNKRIKERNNAAGVLTDLVTPIEEMLLKEEKAAETAENERKQAIKSEREALLKPYEVDTTFFDLVNMPEAAFNQLLENSKLAYEAKIQKEKEAEKKAAYEEKIKGRIVEIVQLGFTPLTDTNDHFSRKIGELNCEITLTQLTMGDDDWKTWLPSLKRDIAHQKEIEDNAAKIKADELAKENARLAAEKAELEKQQKETERKNKVASDRRNLLFAIGINASDNVCFELSDEDFNNYYTGEKSDYEAEQNRIFVEKKKKEFEEAQTKKAAEEKAAAERAAKLAPDKDKIKLAVDQCILPQLELTSGSTEATYATIKSKFEGFKKWANEEVNNLK